MTPAFRAPLAALMLLTGCGSPAGTAQARPSPRTDVTLLSPRTPGISLRGSPAAYSTSGPTPGPGRAAPHVMLVILENREYGEVMHNAGAPAINQLAKRYGEATHAYATTHPSQPNYLELLAGTTFGVTSDDTSRSVEGTTFVDELAARGVAWRAYMEGIAEPCPQADHTSEGYAAKHDPFHLVAHLHRDRCGQVVPGPQLTTDLDSGRAPPFLWVVPSLCDDGHDCPTSVADRWVGRLIPGVQSSDWYRQGGAVIITWDEGRTGEGCCQHSRGGHIATIVVSEAAARLHRVDTPLYQAGILRSLESLYGTGRLGDTACPCSGDLLPLLVPGG